jgi:hypothetical protein
VTPRDELELNILERTGDPDIAEDVGNVVQMLLEAKAKSLAWVMGVEPSMLVPLLWEEVATS